MPSGRVTDSTWITSAPSAASIAAADGPAHHAVRSSTLMPVERQRPRRAACLVGAHVGHDRRRCARRGGAPVGAAARARRRSSTVGGAPGTCRSGRRRATPRSTTCSSVATAGRVGHRRHRDPQLGGQLDDLGGRVLRRPVVDDLVPLVPVERCAGGEPGPVAVLDEVGALDQDAEVVELLRVLVLNPT